MLLLAIALLSPLPGAMLGLWLRKDRRFWRLPLGVLIFALLAVAVAGVLAALYPGPEGRYAHGTIGWVLREFVAGPAGAICFALPSVIALAAARYLPTTRSKASVLTLAMVSGWMCLPVAGFALLFVGCGLAGACL